MAVIYIDNEPYDVAEGQNLLTACLSLGFDIPYFCWHPALNSVGACRMCAVKQFKDEKDSRGRIVMSCITPADHGTRISIDDPEVREFRANIIEFLMLNHPHDCPVCDEGGECHLQDMTVMTGHARRTTRFKKRTYRNQYLGPFLNHEMNRCIQCYRCVRFYHDYAGGRDFSVFGIHNFLYFGRFEEGPLESEFSGNLAEVCPTGAITDKTQKRHTSRNWDLQTAPSICVHCSVGCNTLPGDRYGKLRRIRNRYNGEVNRYFLCDRGRFGYEFVNGESRIRKPFVRQRRAQPPDGVVTLTAETALQHVRNTLGDASGVIGIGSPRASLEANFALRKLVGPDRFYSGVSDSDYRLVAAVLEVLKNEASRSASLAEMERADAVLVLGEDLTNTAPMTALALRQSIRQKPMDHVDSLHVPRWNDLAVRMVVEDVENGPLFVATPAPSKLDDIATETFRCAPDDLARLGFAVAHELNAESPAPTDLPEDLYKVARRIAEALRSARMPLVVSGTSCGVESVIHAAANVAWALTNNGLDSRISLVVPECNSLGLGFIGGGLLSDAFNEARQGAADTAIILENDLYRRAEEESVRSFFTSAKNVVMVDHIDTRSAQEADIVLPASTFADSDGTLVNSEGRAQRFFQVIGPAGDVTESWRWIRDIMVETGRNDVNHWRCLDDIVTDLAAAIPALAQVATVAPLSRFRAHGMKIPRQSNRFSGRTGMRANINVHERKPPDDRDSALAFSMEGYQGQPPSSLITRFWSPGWNSVQSVNKFQDGVSGPLRGGDPGLRLIEHTRKPTSSFSEDIPGPFRPRENELMIVALYHIFGSEELSVLSQGINDRTPTPYVALNPEDADRAGLRDGHDANVVVEGRARVVEVKVTAGIPRGVAGVAVGIPGMRYVGLPAWGQVTRA